MKRYILGMMVVAIAVSQGVVLTAGEAAAQAYEHSGGFQFTEEVGGVLMIPANAGGVLYQDCYPRVSGDREFLVLNRETGEDLGIDVIEVREGYFEVALLEDLEAGEEYEFFVETPCLMEFLVYIVEAGSPLPVPENPGVVVYSDVMQGMVEILDEDGEVQTVEAAYVELEFEPTAQGEAWGEGLAMETYVDGVLWDVPGPGVVPVGRSRMGHGVEVVYAVCDGEAPAADFPEAARLDQGIHRVEIRVWLPGREEVWGSDSESFVFRCGEEEEEPVDSGGPEEEEGEERGGNSGCAVTGSGGGSGGALLLVVLGLVGVLRRRRAVRVAGVLALVCLVLTGCRTVEPVEEPEIQGSTTNAAEATNRVAFAMYDGLRPSGNMVFSPFSVATTMAMVSAGARGETAEEILAFLGFDSEEGDLHGAFRELLREVVLEERDEGTPVVLSANSLWVQQGLAYGIDFLNTLERTYDSEMREVDFSSDPEASRELINQWVEERTRELIPELLSPGGITALTRLVAVNAVYVNAPWLDPFEEGATRERAFTRGDGQVVDVAMMHQEASVNYRSDRELEAIDLRYGNADLSFLVVAPKQGTVGDFLRGLSAEGLRELQESLDVGRVELGLPKFTLDQPLPLKGLLQDLGVERAFSEDADFTPITREIALVLDDVVHQATFSIDERGTEAAAATAGVFRPTGATVGDSVEVVFDRPFAFFLIDRSSGAVLFMGQVVDPS